ncbi:V-type ATP synthase subunit I [Petroclostridium xylanilyticum]|uniref:V-type ATP synthase subunit I n=1 Tax=Petroclostridium xylanilyticum TaxID=1792311 RepID=UPI000B98B53E|nr:V-type ATP synthase subunit I [Petroclostridium xylanilyticum]
MAIVKMDKISLIGLETDKEQIIESLMKMGIVEITNIEQKGSEEEWVQFVAKDGDEGEVSRIEADISRVRSALDYLVRYDTRKKGLFEPKRKISRDQFNRIVHNENSIWHAVDQISHYTEQLSSLRSEENRLLNLIATLEPWKSLAVPVDTTSTRFTTVSLGVVPAIVDTEKLKQDLYEQVPESYLDVINADKDQSYLFVIYYSSLEEEAMKVLKTYGFTKVAFKDLEGTIEENILKAANEIKDIEAEREKVERNIAALANEKDNLEVLHDYLMVQRDRKKALSRMVKTDKVFMLEGWLPEESGEKVRDYITQQWDCVVDIQKPDKEEEYPVLLRNHSLVQPFELITELYSLPSFKGIDPNLFMAPFYFVFFGLMVSDAGYGLVMALITGIILARYKLEGLAHKLIKLLFLGGISTFIWGVMFGGWFGDILPVITQGAFSIPPLWFNPLEDPMRLLTWAFIFGAIHLYTGMALQAYKFIRDGKWLDALFDVGFWYIFLTGFPLWILGGTIGTIGKYMVIAGAVLLVLTQGRTQQGIVKKLLSGVLSLYNVTGFLSDVLSYSRLLALGLATGVIATVINTMGSLFGFNIVGIIILIIVFIGGHTFNILINALGAYVHSSRLQYVEFFGKFYEGGGKAFEPLKINTKYIQLDDKEAI